MRKGSHECKCRGGIHHNVIRAWSVNPEIHRWSDARVYNVNSGNRSAPVEEDTRLGETNFFRYFEEPWIINKLLPVAREYNNRYCRWDIDWFGLDHEMQLARYSNTGDWFEWHQDIDWNITEHLESLHENKYKRRYYLKKLYLMIISFNFFANNIYSI